MHEYARRLEGDLALAASTGEPPEDGGNRFIAVAAAVAQDVFEQDTQDHGQAREILARYGRHVGNAIGLRPAQQRCEIDHR